MQPVDTQPQVEIADLAAQPSTESRAARLAGLALLGVLLLLLLSLLAKDAIGAATSARMWAYPFQFDESEGMIVAETLLLDRGVPIYNTPGPDLFVAAPYPPLFYLLAWPGQHLAGAEPTFKVGRSITLLATLLAGVAIFGIVQVMTKSKLAGLLGASAWWSLSLVTFWGSLVKPDMLALAFGLGGVWWLLARPPRQVWWALPFFLAAFYTKQTAIAAAVAGIFWLLLTRPRTGLAFGAAYAGGALIPSAILIAITNGGYYWHEGAWHIPGLPDPVHALPWMGDRFAEYVTNFASTYALFLVPGTLVLFYLGVRGLLRRFTSDSRPPLSTAQSKPLLLLAYLVMTVVVASGTGTLGGNHNHLLDWAAAGCIGFGVAAGVALKVRGAVGKTAFALGGLIVLAFVPTLFSTPAWLQQAFNTFQTEGAMQSIFQYVTNNSGAAYSDNVGLLLTTGKKLWSTDPYTQTHATRFGRWDESKLVAAFEQKQFAQVILLIDISAPDAGAGDVSPGILQALRDNYKLDQRNVENIYVPK